MKTSRGDEDDDGEPLIFHHAKRTRTGNVMETSEDKEDLEKEIPNCMQHKVWGMEGPSDSHAKVWEDVWDEYLVRVFHKHHRT